MSQGAVFLDRDGTINQEVGYIQELEKLQLIPGAARAIRALNQQGVLCILTTNQSGVARGYYDESWLSRLHQRLEEELKKEGAHLDGLYYCPHLPEGTVSEYAIACSCRKPEPGLLLQAQQDFEVDFERSFMIGDKATDVEVGQRVGSKTILLRSGYGEQVLQGTYQHIPDPDYIMDSLEEAYHKVLKAFFGLSGR